MPSARCPSSLAASGAEHAACGLLGVQGAHAEGPGRNFRAKPHGIDECAEHGRLDGDAIAQVMRESAAGRVAILDR